MSNGIKVVKRDGSTEKINLDKVHKMVEHACAGLAGVSASQVEISSGLQFFDGIKTSDIQEILVRSANDLISLEAPNYQYVAARLLLFGLRKRVYGEHPDNHPPLLEHCLIVGLIMIVTSYSLMQVYVRSLTSTSCKIEAVAKYMRRPSSCT
jgi:ribonucleoside-diphosphate reductase alpha chain